MTPEDLGSKSAGDLTHMGFRMAQRYPRVMCVCASYTDDKGTHQREAEAAYSRNPIGFPTTGRWTHSCTLLDSSMGILQTTRKGIHDKNRHLCPHPRMARAGKGPAAREWSIFLPIFPSLDSSHWRPLMVGP